MGPVASVPRPRVEPRRATGWRAGAAIAVALLLLLAAAVASPARAQGGPPPAPHPAPHREAAPGFVVIANAAGPAALSRDELTRAFLKQGSALLAVDLGKRAEPRAAFSRAVLGRSVGAVITYWHQQIFSGAAVPPPEKGSDAEVVAYVRARANAVGYVSPEAALGPGVRRLDVR